MSKRTSLFSLLLILGLLLTACSPATPAAQPTATAQPAAPTAAAVPTLPPPPAPAVTDTPAAASPTVAPPATNVDVTAYNNLPDLKGRQIKAVTANDFPPLNFIDGKTGKAMGWEYDAIAEICRRLNCTVDWQVTS
ncbi:MAG: hypothetical protein WAV66_09155, partial [Anaerolineae bacterium]